MNDQLGKRTNDRTSGGGRAGAGIAERLEFKGVLFLEGIFNLLTLGARMDTSPHLGYNASLMIASEEKEMRNNSFVFYCRAKCKYIPVSSSRGICRAQFRAIICRNCVPFFLSFFLSFSAVPFSLYSCHSPSYIVILIIRRCRVGVRLRISIPSRITHSTDCVMYPEISLEQRLAPFPPHYPQ